MFCKKLRLTSKKMLTNVLYNALVILTSFLQVTYRVIQVADGQLEAQTDGTTAVSVVAGFPATAQPVTQACVY